MGHRDDQYEQREKVSRTLVEAALRLGAEEGYASLSLRSVAREAGIAPTSFYRHFRDMDELGLAIADRGRAVLDECLDEIEKKMPPLRAGKDAPIDALSSALDGIARPFVETLHAHLGNHSNLMRLFFQERTGNSKRLRNAISKEFDLVGERLARHMEKLAQPVGVRFRDPRLIAESMMTIVTQGCLETWVRPEADPARAVEHTVRKLDLLLLGACLQP